MNLLRKGRLIIRLFLFNFLELFVFTKFCDFSDPNNQSDEHLRNLKWPLYDDKMKSYLEIGDELNVKLHGIFPERLQLWDRLFPIEDMLSRNL